MLRKKRLKPGAIVNNIRSGLDGVVRGDTKAPGKLRRAHRDYVAVRVERTVNGKRRLRYPFWLLEHLRKIRYAH